MLTRNIQNHDRLSDMHELWRQHVLTNIGRDACGDLCCLCHQFRRVLQRLQRIERVHVQRRVHRSRRRAVLSVSDRDVEEHNRLRSMHRLSVLLRRDVHPVH